MEQNKLITLLIFIAAASMIVSAALVGISYKAVNGTFDVVQLYNHCIQQVQPAPNPVPGIHLKGWDFNGTNVRPVQTTQTQ